MAKLYMLIGAPGTGKSTWTAKYERECDILPVIISSDNLIDEYAAQHGLTYTEAFGKVDSKDIDRKIRENFRNAVASKSDIIIDRTNMTVRSRASWLAQVPNDYERIGVLFSLDKDVLSERLEKRKIETGKFIPHHVVTGMLEGYQPPLPTEFDVVLENK